jgi:hypothetical protein
MENSAYLTEDTHFNEYVETRGAWPVYFRGFIGVVLEGKPHDISVEDARTVANALLQ